jgi:ABC-type dipeptide/oligopeptide/nickel transport system ATPase subunit
MSTRTFDDKPAVREQTPLLVGLMGPSGGGKTYSALRLATGIQRVSGGDIYFVDTEARRALHYAEQFKFRHLDFRAPFGPLDYLAAIEHCVAKGAKTIIVDSMSHEHEGPGGVLEMHDAEMNGDFAKSMLAWKKPKGERRRMINTILQMPINFIFCFRAKEKLKVKKGAQPEPMGFMPIAGEEFVFEMTANALLLPNAGGVPTWHSDFQGETMMMKLPSQFYDLFKDPRPMDEKLGEDMARWSLGASKKTLVNLPAGWDSWSNEERGANRASLGSAALQEWWNSLSVADKKTLKPKLDSEWKAAAEGV